MHRRTSDLARTLASLIALTASNYASAAPLANAASDCDVIDVLISADRSQLTRLAIIIQDDGMLAVTVDGDARLLRGAEDCALGVYRTGALEDEDFDLNCAWAFDRFDEAVGRLSLLRARVQSCLSAPLEQQSDLYQSEYYQVLERWERSYPSTDGNEYVVDVSLAASQYGEPETYSLSFNFSR